MPQPKKQRLDLVLAARGLAATREQAQALIMAGTVLVDGQRADVAGMLVGPGVVVTLRQGPRYVSRGGEKLQHALEHFRIDVRGAVALDVGASTGGFSDCLLQQGVTRVYAVDAGRGQLHHRLRQDGRVVSLEQVNAHHRFDLPEQAGLATVDVSFISLSKVLPNVAPHVSQGGWLICLVKPQFEAARHRVEKGGVVKDPLVHGAVLSETIVWAIAQGFRVRGVTASPRVGDAGNREFFLLLQVPQTLHGGSVSI